MEKRLPYYSFLLLFLLCLSTVTVQAQTPEVEPNDALTSANNMAYGTAITGQLYCTTTDNDDYFRVVLPAGTKSLRLITKAKMQSGTGGAYFYLYNKYGSQLTNYYQPLTTTWVTDTLDYPCFEGDTFYVRAYHWSGGCKDYEITTGTAGSFLAGADPEGNDAFATATPLSFNFDTSGHLANQRYGATTAFTDNDDYYRVVPPAGNKGLRLISKWRAATPGGTGGAYVYLYNKFQQQLTVNYVSFGNTWVNDTLNYPCFEGDTFFVRVYNWSGDCKEYRMRTTTPNVYTVSNDRESNDSFDAATTIPFATDTSGHLASQRYGATTAFTDDNDYYRVVPPAGNRSLRLVSKWRATTPGGSGGAYVYLYNKFQQQLTNNYISFDNTWKTDTLDFPCFEGDTFYVRMYNWSGYCKEYTFNAGTANSFLAGDDPEVNDNIASATPLAFNTDTSGHLASQRYRATGSYTDNDDYYRVVAPAGNRGLRLISQWRSVTPGTTGGAYTYLYNKAGTQLTVKYVSFGNNWVRDTLDYACFEGDTFFVRTYNWSGNCKEYRLRTTTPGVFTMAGDAEPNSTLATATPLAFRRDTTGTLGTQQYGAMGIYTDVEDYYRMVMPNNDRGIRILINARDVTPGGTGGYYLYIYNKAGSQLINKYITLNNTLRTDTLDFPCFSSDTFYVRMYNWSGSCKEYSLRADYADNGPVASRFERTRFGNSFSFVNRSLNADKYLWTFGDGRTDTTAYPVHDFGIGQFPIKMKATGFCGTQEFKDTVQVEGIEYYTPKSAATTYGYGYFNLRVFGAGMDSGAVIQLKRGSTVLRPTRIKGPSTKELNALFSMSSAEAGLYDVEIKLTGGQTFSYPEGFRIFADTPGAVVTTQLNGPARIRTGSWTNYSLLVKNNKHSIAIGVPVFIAVPEGVETNIQEVLRKKTGVFRVQGSDYDQLTIDREYYNQVYYDGKFDPNTDIIEMDYNALLPIFDTLVRISIDSLYGQPFKGTLYPIYVPAIVGAGTWQVNFKMKAVSNGDYKPKAYAWPFVAHINPSTGEILTYVHDGGLLAASAAEYAPNPALQAVGKSAAYVDVGSQVAFTEFFDWYYGTNVADEDYYERQGGALVVNAIGDLIPIGDGANNALRKVEQSKDNIRRLTQHANITEDLLRNDLRFLLDGKKWDRARGNLTELLKRADEWKGNLQEFQKIAVTLGLADIATSYGMNKLSDALGNYLFPDELHEKTVKSVTSLDPNAIYGPDGPGSAQYIKRNSALDYLVTFENVDTALAPAAVVRVELKLDTAKFDLRRTTLGNVTIGGKTYLVEADRREYFRDIDLRPSRNMIVRVNAHFDSTGRGYWEFTSLDPLTRDLLSDPDLGFLPPNVAYPEGEGSVSFVTYLKPGVGNRDSVSAQASIFFDANEPILTNRWHNTIDEGLPATTLDPAITVTNDSLMSLTITGADAESGLARYAVYMKADSTWMPRPIYFRPDGTAPVVQGTPGVTYSFYVVAKDSVGNNEQKPGKTPEATVTLPRREGPAGGNAFALYPNPSTGQLFIRAAQDRAGATLAITNYMGKIMATQVLDFKAGSIVGMDLTSYANGIYLIQVSGGGGATETYKVVLEVPRR